MSGIRTRRAGALLREQTQHPEGQIVGAKCPTTEEISRLEYDETIAKPLRETFEKKVWWKLREEEHPAGKVEETRMRFVALIRGVPLKIKPHFEEYEGDKPSGPDAIATHNEASVDSETCDSWRVYAADVRGDEQPLLSGFQRIADTPIAPLAAGLPARRADA